MPELPEVETVRRGLAAALGLPFHRKSAEQGENPIEFAALPELRRWHFARSTLRYPLPIPALEGIKGMRLLAIERRSKYLLLYFMRQNPDFTPESGSGSWLANFPSWAARLQLCRVLVHLGMSGRLRITNAQPEPAKHDHLWLQLTRSTGFLKAAGFASHEGRDFYLIYNDTRRFGFWMLEGWQNSANTKNNGNAPQGPFCRVGPEPLPLEEYHFHAPLTLAWHKAEMDCSATNTNPIALENGKLGEWLYHISRMRPSQGSHPMLGPRTLRKIKPWILEGRAVCGVGNIYCCESLWRAGISPHKSTHSLNPAEAETLADALQQCISDAIAAGGTTIRDFHSVAGESGYFQQELCVYQRTGQQCLRPGCTTKIEKCTQGQRSTFYCPSCQALK